MDAEAELKKRVEQDKAELEQAEAAKRAREGELRKKIESLEAEIESIRAERNKLAHTLPPNLVKQYGNMIEQNNCAVVGGQRSLRRLRIRDRPQIHIELQMRSKVNFCESCGRILIERFDDI